LSNFHSILKLSIIDQLNLGSIISIRTFQKCRYNISTSNVLNFGSALSLRKFTKLSSCISICLSSTTNASCSLTQGINYASCLSLRSTANGRGSLHISVFEFWKLGSTLSVRRGLRLGSSISIDARNQDNIPKHGRSFSVLDACSIGSSFSCRASSSGFGRPLTALEFVALGSTFSIRTSWLSLSKQLSAMAYVFYGSSVSLRRVAKVCAS
jgi:hypothetical protein